MSREELLEERDHIKSRIEYYHIGEDGGFIKLYSKLFSQDLEHIEDCVKARFDEEIKVIRKYGNWPSPELKEILNTLYDEEARFREVFKKIKFALVHYQKLMFEEDLKEINKLIENCDGKG